MNKIKDQNILYGPAAGAVVLLRRAIAFALDSLVLGAIGMALIFFFFDPLSALGERGRLIGFAIGSAYFGWFEGGSRRHQSPGKRVMQLKVVRCGEQGTTPLSVARAWYRYAIVAIPFVLHGLTFVDLPQGTPGWQSFLTLNDTIIMIWEGALAYLFVFNRPSRRSLHDLATSSAVVPWSTDHATSAPVARGHWLGIAGLAALLVSTLVIVGHLIPPKQGVDLAALQQSVASVKGVSVTSITTRSEHWVGGNGPASYSWATIDVRVRQPSKLNAESALAVAKTIVLAGASHLPQEQVQVNFSQTANLGIANRTSWRSASLDAKQLISKVSVTDQREIDLESEAVSRDPEVLAMLDRGDYAGLDKKLGSLQKRFEAGQLDELSLKAIYQPFTLLTPAQEVALQAWAKARPASYTAHLALGYHYKVLAWKARGDDFTADTPRQNFVKMYRWLELSNRELQLSMKLTPKPYMTVYHLQDIASLVGNKQASDQLVAAGTLMLPHARLVRERYLRSLMPRWGGSYEQMREFIDMSRKDGADPACVEQMEISLDGQMASHAWREKNYAEANRLYLIVLDRASQLGLKSGTYIDDAYRYICTTSKEARYCGAGTSTRFDLAHLSQCVSGIHCCQRFAHAG